MYFSVYIRKQYEVFQLLKFNVLMQILITMLDYTSGS